MAFQLKSGNKVSFKEMGGSAFSQTEIGDKLKNIEIKKPDLGNLGDKLKGDGGPKISLKGKGGGKGTKDLIKTKVPVTGGVEKTKFKVDKKSSKPTTPKKPKVKKPKTEVKKTEAPKKRVKEETFAKDTKGMTTEQQATAYTDMIKGKADKLPTKPSKTGSRLDTLQTSLTAAGLTPGVGNIADLANTAISGGRAGYAGFTGDKEGVSEHLTKMGINAASAIPVVGQAVAGTSLAADIGERTGLIDTEKQKFASKIQSPKGKEDTWTSDRGTWSPGGSTS